MADTNEFGEPVGPPCARCDGDHPSAACPHYSVSHKQVEDERKEQQRRFELQRAEQVARDAADSKAWAFVYGMPL